MMAGGGGRYFCCFDGSFSLKVVSLHDGEGGEPL